VNELQLYATAIVATVAFVIAASVAFITFDEKRKLEMQVFELNTELVATQVKLSNTELNLSDMTSNNTTLRKANRYLNTQLSNMIERHSRAVREFAENKAKTLAPIMRSVRYAGTVTEEYRAEAHATFAITEVRIPPLMYRTTLRNDDLSYGLSADILDEVKRSCIHAMVEGVAEQVFNNLSFVDKRKEAD